MQAWQKKTLKNLRFSISSLHNFESVLPAVLPANEVH